MQVLKSNDFKILEKAPDIESGALLIMICQKDQQIMPARLLLQELPQRELLQQLLRSLRDRWEQQP